MKKFTALTTITLIVLFTFAKPATAANFSVGVAASEQPGISVQLQSTMYKRFHFVGHFNEGEQVMLSADIQKFFYPRFLSSGPRDDWNICFYAGMGIEGRSSIEDVNEENFFGRLPLGVQFESRALPVQAFTEITPLLGPIPNTKLSATASGGIRVSF